MLLLQRILERLVDQGSLLLIDPGGVPHFYGQPSPSGDAEVVLRLHGSRKPMTLLLQPVLWLGEAYMEGELTVERGSISDLLELCARNVRGVDADPLVRLGHAVDRLGGWLRHHNGRGRSRRNVAHHYDLSDRLYELFLDADRQYSCAYFDQPGMSLDQAQLAKKRHLASKLLLRPGQRVLDIGSGWGGLGLYLAESAGVDVTGITLSAEQLAFANRRAAIAGMVERVRFALRDYREENGRYDRIVSVGMFEHVGPAHYLTFFRKLRELLTDDGVAVLHSIGSTGGRTGGSNPWLRKYIFPGGYTPSLSQVLNVVERVGLFATDIEVLRLHYAETLRHWRHRFQVHRSEICGLYDERFCRMWEFYLALCEVAFRCQRCMVFQLQLAKRADIVPICRDYMLAAEQDASVDAVGGRRAGAGA